MEASRDAYPAQLATLCLFHQQLRASLLDFAANVAHFNLFRFAGRPGKYNKLFNRWRLEEVSGPLIAC